MKKGQVIFDFLVLGTIVFVLTFVIAYKYERLRVFKYLNLENNLSKTTIMIKSHKIPEPIPYKEKDKTLISTEYFSYYLPACLKNMTGNCEKSKTQMELRDAISEIVGQLEDHEIAYNPKYYNNLYNSINYYINAETRTIFTAETIMNNAYNIYKEDLLKSKSPVAKQNAELTGKIIGHIKSFNKSSD